MDSNKQPSCTNCHGELRKTRKRVYLTQPVGPAECHFCRHPICFLCQEDNCGLFPICKVKELCGRQLSNQTF